jgi:hypothetical protein
MEAFLELLADGKINVRTLITHRVPIERASHAYEIITAGRSEPFLGVLITYPETAQQHSRLEDGFPKEAHQCGFRPAGLHWNAGRGEFRDEHVVANNEQS